MALTVFLMCCEAGALHIIYSVPKIMERVRNITISAVVGMFSIHVYLSANTAIKATKGYLMCFSLNLSLL